MTTFRKRLTLAGGLGALMLFAASAGATPYVITLQEQGSDVVASGSGMIDLTGLTFQFTSAGGGASLGPSDAFIATGSQASSVPVDGYTGFAGPTSFGPATGFISADATSGDSVDMIGNPSFYGIPMLFVPSGYVSDSSLSGTATFSNSTFASLGVTFGTYVWTWGTAPDQSYTLIIGIPNSVAEPAGLGLFGLGALLIGAFAGLRRRLA